MTSALSTWVNRHLAQNAVRDNPPLGQFLRINGFRLHYIDTVSPIVSRVMWSLLMAKIFGPQSVPEKFDGFPTATGTVMSAIHEVGREPAGAGRG